MDLTSDDDPPNDLHNFVCVDCGDVVYRYGPLYMYDVADVCLTCQWLREFPDSRLRELLEPGKPTINS